MDDKTKKQLVRQRLLENLCWHVHAEDYDLPDNDLVVAVIGRYRKHRESYIIDPSE
jgi:hypothetical protein